MSGGYMMGTDLGKHVAIIVHGGAWSIPDQLVKPSISGVEEAAIAGWNVLSSKGSALDAVEKAVNVMESNPVFNAGIGSALNEEGEIELDAMIMDGKTLNAGSVAGVRKIKNPASLARKIMEKTDHIMVIGEGAQRLAKKWRIKEISTENLKTEEALEKWEKYNIYKKTVKELYNIDTVGAVAIDSDRNIAAATSTGGISAKKVGRVGDCPIIGCGAYADNEIGGTSATGHGESIMKVTLARLVLFLIENGMNVQEAAEKGLVYMKEKVDGNGGIIVLNSKGEIGQYFTTERMAWAYIKEKKLKSGIERSK